MEKQKLFGEKCVKIIFFFVTLQPVVPIWAIHHINN